MCNSPPDSNDDVEIKEEEVILPPSAVDPCLTIITTDTVQIDCSESLSDNIAEFNNPDDD